MAATQFDGGESPSSVFFSLPLNQINIVDEQVVMGPPPRVPYFRIVTHTLAEQELIARRTVIVINVFVPAFFLFVLASPNLHRRRKGSYASFLEVDRGIPQGQSEPVVGTTIFFLRWRDKIVDAGWPPFGFQKITDNCVVVMRTAKDARYLRGWPWTSPNESAGNDARSTADTPNTLPNLSTCPRTRATVLSGRWCNGCTDAFTSFSRAPWSKHHKKFSYLRLRGSCRCWKFARVKLISRRNKHFHQRTFLSCRPLVEQWRFLVASRSTCQNNKNFKYLQLLGSLKCG